MARSGGGLTFVAGEGMLTTPKVLLPAGGSLGVACIVPGKALTCAAFPAVSGGGDLRPGGVFAGGGGAGAAFTTCSPEELAILQNTEAMPLSGLTRKQKKQLLESLSTHGPALVW